jgi:hypothetical protein
LRILKTEKIIIGNSEMNSEMKNEMKGYYAKNFKGKNYGEMMSKNRSNTNGNGMVAPINNTTLNNNLITTQMKLSIE